MREHACVCIVCVCECVYLLVVNGYAGLHVCCAFVLIACVCVGLCVFFVAFIQLYSSTVLP